MTAYQDVFYASPDGLELYARDYPGPAEAKFAILCMPGLTRNARDFEVLAARLSPRYRVICADQRGRGRSAYDPNPQNYHPGTYVQDMVALLDHLHVGKVVLIGTSLGGLMAMILMAMLPERILGVVLNDIGPEVDQKGIERIESYAGKLPPVQSWADAEQQTRTLNAEIFPDFGDDEWRQFTRGLYREDAEGVPVLDYDPAIAGGLQTGNAVPADLWPLVEGMKAVPVVAIRGALSDILSPETFAEMQRRLPAMTSVTVANRGHAPLLSEPAALEAIEGLLAKVAS